MKIGFRTSIITLFVSIVLIVGLSLVYFSFNRATSIIRSAATTFIDKVAEHTADRIDTQFKDVRDSVEILTSLPAVQDGQIDNTRTYTLMAALLRNHSQLFNLYAGYDDGSFLELDVINRAGRAFREKLGAPAEAIYRLLLIRVPGAGNERIATTSFLSETLAELAENHSATKYDPRERLWYADAYAPNAGVLTEPYIFFASGQPGYTLRIPLRKGRRGVVAGDILLTDADALLRNQQLGPSGVAFLFDDSGRIVAHPRMAELITETRDGSSIALPYVSDVYKSGIAPAARAWKAGKSPQQFFTGDDGRTYVASFRSIETASSANLRLIVMAPLDEFFAAALAQRRTLFLVALGLVLTALPSVFWLGSMMSRSISAIATETDRIQRFEPGDTTAHRSLIQEIDDLGRSVFTMRKVVETFSNFVPKHLVQQLIETGTPLGLGGVRREVTILFTDVADFTAITERARPEQVMSHTSAYFGVMSEAIMANKGTVDKFIGDAVMAIWNAPTLDAYHVTNGCTAILACQAAISKLNLRFEREQWPAYRTRFGLHVGNVVVGNVGSSDRMNYTVLGASVNLASRLESLNKVYRTTALVSEQIKLGAGDRFLFRSVDRISPKGFAEKFPIFELCCAREAAGESERALCEDWEKIYAALDVDDRSLKRLEEFLLRYPDDGIARYHADNIIRQLGGQRPRRHS